MTTTTVVLLFNSQSENRPLIACRKAAETCDRIIDLLENEWGFTEETDLQKAKKEKARLLAKS